MMKMEKSQCEILDIDNSVDIQIDDLEENLCRTYYQVDIFFDQNVVDTLIYKLEPSKLRKFNSSS